MALFGQHESVAASPALGGARTGIFSCHGTYAQEMQRFEALRKVDGKAAERVIREGAELLALASAGNVEKLALKASATTPNYWFAVKAFTAAAAAGHVDVLDFMLTNGIDLDHPPLNDILHQVALQAAAEDGGRAARPVATYLVKVAGRDVS